MMTPVKKSPKLPKAGSNVWAVTNTLVVFTFVTAFCYLNAQHFDATEIRVVFWSTLSWVGYEAIKTRRPR